MSSEKTVTLHFTNNHNHSIQFHLQPWGEVYDMPAGATYIAIARGEECDFERQALEIEYAQDVVTLYGITGSVVTVFHDEQEL